MRIFSHIVESKFREREAEFGYKTPAEAAWAQSQAVDCTYITWSSLSRLNIACNIAVPVWEPNQTRRTATPHGSAKSMGLGVAPRTNSIDRGHYKVVGKPVCITTDKIKTVIKPLVKKYCKNVSKNLSSSCRCIIKRMLSTMCGPPYGYTVFAGKRFWNEKETPMSGDQSTRKMKLIETFKRKSKPKSTMSMDFALKFARGEECIRPTKFVPFVYKNKNKISSRKLGEILELVYKIPRSKAGLFRFIEARQEYVGVMDERLLVETMKNTEFRHQFGFMDPDGLRSIREYVKEAAEYVKRPDVKLWSDKFLYAVLSMERLLMDQCTDREILEAITPDESLYK